MMAIFTKGYVHKTKNLNVLQIFLGIGCGNTKISFFIHQNFLYTLDTIIFRLIYFNKFMPQCELRETHTYIFDRSVSIYCKRVSIVQSLLKNLEDMYLLSLHCGLINRNYFVMYFTYLRYHIFYYRNFYLMVKTYTENIL